MKLFLSFAIAVGAWRTSCAADYGIDCSFPVKSAEFRCGNLLGDRKTIYDKYMQGCREHAGPKKASMCDSNEQERFEMSKNQPRSMVVS